MPRVKGSVDDQNRALLPIVIRKSPTSPSEEVIVWIDTAFDGHLVLSRMLIQQLGLESLVDTEAILADGQKVVLETFIGYADWFGALVPLQVIANDGKFPLLGTQLLAGRTLHIDYASKHLNLS
jgi:clan AA aspartic protease